MNGSRSSSRSSGLPTAPLSAVVPTTSTLARSTTKNKGKKKVIRLKSKPNAVSVLTKRPKSMEQPTATPTGPISTDSPIPTTTPTPVATSKTKRVFRLKSKANAAISAISAITSPTTTKEELPLLAATPTVVKKKKVFRLKTKGQHYHSPSTSAIIIHYHSLPFIIHSIITIHYSLLSTIHHPPSTLFIIHYSFLIIHSSSFILYHQNSSYLTTIMNSITLVIIHSHHYQHLRHSHPSLTHPPSSIIHHPSSINNLLSSLVYFTMTTITTTRTKARSPSTIIATINITAHPRSHLMNLNEFERWRLVCICGI